MHASVCCKQMCLVMLVKLRFLNSYLYCTWNVKRIR